MKLNLISWNIRHLRMEKVVAYLEHILEQVATGHVLFFYENKESNLMDGFVKALGKQLAKSDSAGSMRLHWKGFPVSVGTNENVWIVFSTDCTTGPFSKHGQGVPFTLDVQVQANAEAEFRRVGNASLKTSYNLTLLQDIQQNRVAYRVPALVHITLNKPDGTSKLIRVAAWHAPGPAKGIAPILNAAFQQAMHGHVDIFLGDFNMTGLDRTPRGAPLPFSLQRTNQSTTITGDGLTKHKEGLDLVYMDQARIAPGVAASGNQIANATVCAIPIPTGLSYQEAWDISDHLPLEVTLKGL